MNAADIILIVIISAVLINAVIKCVRRKKQGGCGCGCSGCVNSGSCPSTKNKE